jgi:hypothetical protein
MSAEQIFTAADGEPALIDALKEFGCSLLTFPKFDETGRGILSFAQYPDHIPFVPMRHFLVFGMSDQVVRGAHAHRTCAQLLICLRGTVKVLLDDGERRVEVLLSEPHHGLFLPPMLWSTQTYSPADSMLLVLCPQVYDRSGYILEYTEYLKLRRDSTTD